jgi:MerR family transcriptional regulator, thiopeptide resistance regulator
MRRIGEVAAATGLTVRTLHHYDEIGLLAASERSEAGYRLYSDTDVRRLYRIVAFRRLGFALSQIAPLLDRDGGDPRRVVRDQLAQLDAELALKRRLRERLERLIDALDRDGGAAADLFLQAIEGMTMSEQYYTPEQLAQLDERSRALGEDGMRRAEQEWADLIGEAEALRAQGTDPSDPRVQAIAARWQELIEQFTGGDDGIRASLQRMYETEGTERASRGMVSPELMAWMGRAFDAGR